MRLTRRGHISFKHYKKGLLWERNTQIGPANDVWWWCRVRTRSFWPYMEISNFDGGHLGFFPKGLAYDFGSKFQISSKLVHGQIGPGNDVWWWRRVRTRSFWPYMEISNFDGGHLGFFPKGLAYDFGSKFQSFSKFVHGQIGPANAFNLLRRWGSPFSLASSLWKLSSNRAGKALRVIKALKPLNHDKVGLLWEEHKYKDKHIHYTTRRTITVTTSTQHWTIFFLLFLLFFF